MGFLPQPYVAEMAVPMYPTVECLGFGIQSGFFSLGEHSSLEALQHAPPHQTSDMTILTQ